MRKNTLARQVRRAYCQDTLQRVCTLREDRFGRAFGMQTVKVAQRGMWRPSDRPEDYYHFRDNGGRVLAVAHLDTVVRGDRRTPRFRETERGPTVVSGALDDRLGAYVILDLLPKLGITCDWLLTVGEESGMSTAEHFRQGKAYDHVIEFDRMGTDVVMYQYDDRATRRLVEASGAAVGQGSFSDIAYLEQLDVKCFNWGVGYQGNYHSEKGYAYLNDTFAMVAKYLRFHEQNAGVPMPHEGWGSGSRSYAAGKWDDEDCYTDCMSCGEKEVVDSVTWYCTFCGVCQDCGGTEPDIAAEWNDPDVDICQCYLPKHAREEVDQLDARDEAAEAGSSDIRVNAVTTGRMTSTPGRLAGDLKGLTWAEYLAQRPGAWSDDGGKTWHSTDEESSDRPELCGDCGKDLVDECRCDKEGPAFVHPAPRKRSPSIAPPWSEHRVNAAGTGWAAGSLGAAAQRAIAPPRGGNWHEAAGRGPQLVGIPGHAPGPEWARTCLRCAARWPHQLAAGNSDRTEAGAERSRVITAPSGTHLHAGRDCPGCERCIAANAGPGTSMLHVIPAHFPGVFANDSVCAECNAMERVFPDADPAAGLISRETARRQAILDSQPATTAGELSASDR